MGSLKNDLRTWRIGLTLIALLGVVNGLVWMSRIPQRWYEGTDSAEYHLLAANLVDGHGFSRAHQAPYLPTNFREPGYSSLVAAVYAVSNQSSDAVAVVQSMLLGLSALLSTLIGYRVFGDRRVALLGGVLVALSPDLGDHARYEMSEALFVPVLLLATWLALRAWQTRSTPLGAWSGLVYGLAGYVRVMALPTGMLVAAASVVWDWWHGERRIRWAAVLIAVMLLSAVPWMARNQAELGRLSFTGRSGAYVLPRADKAAAPLDKQLEWNLTSLWVVTYPFSALVVPTERLHAPNSPLWDGPLGNLELMDTTRALNHYCLDVDDVTGAQDACFMQEGVAMIRSHPLQYVLMTPVEFVRLTFYVYPSRLSVARNWVVWMGLVTLAICLVKRNRRTPERLWLACVIAAYTLPSIAGDTQPRYGVPLVPFYSLFAAAGLVWLVERWGRPVAGRVLPSVGVRRQPGLTS